MKIIKNIGILVFLTCNLVLLVAYLSFLFGLFNIDVENRESNMYSLIFILFSVDCFFFVSFFLFFYRYRFSLKILSFAGIAFLHNLVMGSMRYGPLLGFLCSLIGIYFAFTVLFEIEEERN